MRMARLHFGPSTLTPRRHRPRRSLPGVRASRWPLPPDIRTAHAAFASVAAVLGRVDTLVNAAAIYLRKPIFEITDADWDASMAINVKGSDHRMVAAVRQMRGQGPMGYVRGQVRGRIVNITSVAPAGKASERARALGFPAELAKPSPLGRGGDLREMAEWVLMAGGPRKYLHDG